MGARFKCQHQHLRAIRSICDRESAPVLVLRLFVSDFRADFANLCTMPGFATADARYAYQWGAAELALGIANLTNRKYYTQAYGCTGAGVTTAIYPEPGRTITASLLFKF